MAVETKKRQERVALTMTPELLRSFGALSAAVERPMATVIVEILGEMIPQIDGITKVTLATRSGNRAAAKRAVVHMFGDALAEVMAMQQPDMFPTASAKKRRRK